MLSVSWYRTLCTSGSLLARSRLLRSRQPVYNTVTCPVTCSVTCPVTCPVTCAAHMCTSCLRRDTWDRHRQLQYQSNPLLSLRSYCTGEVSCWSCRQTVDSSEASFFCSSCQVVQPPAEGTSYFKIMDCDYTFTVDTQKLQRRYLQLQRALHPDNFSQKSEKEQQYSESHSALVNKAYQTLLKPLSRGLYMLELQGLRIEEGTDSGAGADFLMELMEINEALDEAQSPEEAEKIGRDTKVKLAELTEHIDAALLKGELLEAKALLVQMKYFTNIQDKVKEKLSEFM